ncbi:MAG: hybrid sensor histidine kinase/response regulator [Ponticaulis sp.]|nr:hybrid sensor histidine kinase/response regulator [Ponticaulis sp.]|tara:strand:+ start:78811 stop:80289 length:1479 start_codon:yes stop_codon:yes gene_type:complete
MNKPKVDAVEDRFLATVSHEIRTPLNGILGMASLLAETELTPAQSDYVSAIRQSGARLLDLLNNVLDYARMDATGIELENSETDVRQLAQEVVELLSPRAHAKGLDVCVRMATDFPSRTVLDDGRLRQILFNLIGNAIKFTETGGVLVDLSVNRDGHSLRIDIIDSGPGLSDEAQSRLFSAFEQAEARHRGIDGGVGLGLTIVKRLITAMNGDIALTSAPGIGARFRLSLPLETDVSAPHQILTAEQPLKIGLAGLSTPLMLSLTSMAIQAGHQVTIGPEKGDVDVWLADVSLPPRLLKELSQTAPVLALIRPEDREHVASLRTNGCHGYLMRPVRASSLTEQLKRLGEAADFSEGSDEVDIRSRGDRVLVADDNAVNSLLAIRTLEKAGYSTASAATGAEAVEAVETSVFSCILMDLRMPVMDGYEAMRRIRELAPPKNNIPIIAISAEINPDVEKAAKTAGANAVAAKPLDPQTLRSIVERWTDKQKAEQ